MQALVWLLLATLPCFALHESDVGKVDWHKPLIGVPRTESLAVAPKFQLVAGKNKRSVVVAVSKGNVLAAVNAPDGELAWRHVLEPGADTIGLYKSNPGFVSTLSGPGGATLRSYNISNGDILFESRLHKPQTGLLLEPPSIGQDIIFSVDETNDIFTLTNAHTVKRVHGYTGEVIWSWTSEDQTSSTLYSKLVMTKSTVFAIGLTKSFKSYGLHVVSLDADKGHYLSSINLPSSINGPSHFVVLTSAKSPNPILTWLDDGHVKSQVLNQELSGRPKSLHTDIYREIQDIGVSDAGVFVALKRDGTSHVLRVTKSSDSVERVWEFDNSADSSEVSKSIYMGGFDWAGQPYVGRYYWSHAVGSATLHVLVANGPEDQPLVTGFMFAFEPSIHGHVQHYSIEVANPDPMRYFSRVVYTTSTGAMQQWLQADLKWTRDESLADVKSVEFVDLPEIKIKHSALAMQSFITRITRHLEDARNLPQYLSNFVQRFLLGSTAAKARAKVSAKNIKRTPSPLWRDEFGFRKLLVIATSSGKVFGIDSDGGHIVWSRYLEEAMSGDLVTPLKLFTTVSVSDGKEPEVVLLANQEAATGKFAILYRFEALTGRNLARKATQANLFASEELFRGSILEAYSLRSENRTIAVIGDDQKVYLYPSTTSSPAHFAAIAHRLYFSLHTINRLTGHQVNPSIETNSYSMYQIWTASIDPSEDVQAVIRRPHEPVASLGKVLGDRSTLYKYLNPHLTAVLTASRGGISGCGVYLIDGVRGNVLYHARLPATGGVCNVHAALTENWFVYHYYDPDSRNDTAKGFRIVSLELYEGGGMNEKTRSADLTSYSYDSTLLTVFQRSYVYPVGVTALAITSTKFGITSKDLIVANTRQHIHTIPRRFLDPRRPRDKPSPQELEEWLIQYDPVLPDDGRHVISHEYQVAGTSNIVTSPALLESTSIVFSYGIDLFLTRVAPSKTFDILSENFNKAQLALTVGALTAGVLITRPMVRKKMLRRRWYYL